MTERERAAQVITEAVEQKVTEAANDAYERGRVAGYAEAIEKAATVADEFAHHYKGWIEAGAAASIAKDIRALLPGATTKGPK